MINDVGLERIIVSTWQFADDLLPQSGSRPTNFLNDTQDATDFMTLRRVSKDTWSSNINREEHLGTSYWKKRSGIDFWYLFVNGFNHE